MKPTAYKLLFEHNNRNYIINTYRNSVIEVSKETYELLKNNQCINSDCTEYQKLCKSGILVSDNLNEYQRIVNNEQAMIFGNHDAIAMVIAPTMKCNYKCSYCFENYLCERNTMSPQVIEDVKRYVISMLKKTRAKSLYMEWFGGEPTLAMDIINGLSNYFIEYCDSNGIKYDSYIVTNSYMITDDMIQDFIKDRISSVKITLDGSKEMHLAHKNAPKDAYEKTIENIQKLSKYMHVDVSLNILEENYDILYDFIDEIAEYFSGNDNIDIFFAEIYYSDSTKEQLSNSKYFEYFGKVNDYIKSKGMRPNYKNRYCTRGCTLIYKNNAYIDTDGKLYRCERHIGDPKHIIGNCKAGLFHNEVDNRYTTYNSERPEKCKTCPIFPMCRSGCAEDILEHRTPRIKCEQYIQDTINYYKDTLTDAFPESE